jgi:hypothetical protein
MMKKWTTLLLALTVLCASWLPVMAEETPGVLGIVEIRGLDSLSASAAELALAVGSPLPKEMISLMLYGQLGTMPGMGLQAEGSVRAVLFQGETPAPEMALLLPANNEGADYLAGLAAAGWANEAETAEGIQHFIGPQENQMVWKEIYFLPRGNTLIAGQSADAVRLADAALPTLPPILPVEGDIAIQIRPALALEAYEALIQAGLEEGLKPKPNQPPESAAIAKLYMEGYLALGKQVDAMVLGIGVADGNLNLHQRVAPVADSVLARYLASIGTPSAAASVVNLPDALYAETAHAGDLNIIAPAYFGYMEEMLKLMPKAEGSDGPSDEFLDSYMANAKKYWTQMNGDIGISLLPPTPEYPLRLVEYVGLKDATGLREMTRTMIDSVNEMMESVGENPDAPIEIEMSMGEPREYREVSIDTLTYGVIPGGQIAALWPEMLPKQLKAEIAWVPNGLLVSVGDPSQTEGLVDSVLDGSATPLTSRAAWKAVYPMPEKNLVDVTHLSIFEAIRSYMELVESYRENPSDHVAMVPAGPGNLESACYMALGGVMSRIRFSLADIAAIAEKVQEVQAAQAQTQADFMQQMQMEMDEMNEGDFETIDEEEFEEWTAGDEEIEAPAAPMAPTPAPAQ